MCSLAAITMFGYFGWCIFAPNGQATSSSPSLRIASTFNLEALSWILHLQASKGERLLIE